MSAFDQARALVDQPINMTRGETENPDKRVDADVLNAAFFRTINERIAFFHTTADDCRDAGSDAVDLKVYIENSYRNVGTNKYSMGMANSGYEILAFDATHSWYTTALSADHATINDACKTTGAAVADYKTTYLGNAALHFIITQGVPGLKWAANQIALSSNTGGINAYVVPMHANAVVGGDWFAKDEMISAAMDRICNVLDGYFDPSTNAQIDGSISGDSINDLALVTVQPYNDVEGGFSIEASNQDYNGVPLPWGWMQYGAPTNVELSITQSHSGRYSCKVVGTGSDQGIYKNVDGYAHKGQKYCINCYVYTSIDTSIKIQVLDGFTIQTYTKPITNSTWTHLNDIIDIAAGCTNIELRILTTAACTVYIDDIMAHGGDHSLGYEVNINEAWVVQNTDEQWENLGVNPGFQYFGQPWDSVGAARKADYPPLGWQLTDGSGTIESVADTTNGLYSEKCWRLKLFNTDVALNDCVAPVTEYAKRYRSKYLSIGVELMAHGTPGVDPIQLFLKDGVGTTTRDIAQASLSNSVYRQFWITRLIDAAATYITFGLRNVTAGATYAQFYVAGYIVKVGRVPMSWKPSNNFDIKTIGFGKKSVLSASYMETQGVTSAATNGVPIKGCIVGIQASVKEGTAPTAPGNDVLDIEWNGTASGDKLCIPATDTDDMISTTLPMATIAGLTVNGEYGAFLSSQILSVSAVAGGNAILTIEAFVLK